MTYPDYPNNRLIVNDVDLSIRFRLFLLDGFTLSPPEPKTYTVDIPGGDGVIDLTESLTGDVAYNNREMEFTFVSLDVEDYEYAKTRLSNFLHGKEYDFKMTMDPDYNRQGLLLSSFHYLGHLVRTESHERRQGYTTLDERAAAHAFLEI